jgi:uncharacterized protein
MIANAMLGMHDMRAAAIALTLCFSASGAWAQSPPPILDVHLHADPVGDWRGAAICAPFEEWPAWDPAEYASYESFFTEVYLQGKACVEPLWGAETDEELMRQTIEIMQRRNVYGVLSADAPEHVAAWRAAAPGRFMPALSFSTGAADALSPDSLRRLVLSGDVEVFGEIYNFYDGVAPDDPRMEPYWALAEELDVPVAYHLNPGRPGEPHGGSGARGGLVSALTLEEVLVRHPRLRLYIMHAGYPLLEDLLVVLHSHPQVYIDISDLTPYQPRLAFYSYLRRIIDAGFGNRVMFGSDQMVWPEAIDRAIASIEDAPFLSETQKRDILYNNAARFLRLSEAEMARHHGR